MDDSTVKPYQWWLDTTLWRQLVAGYKDALAVRFNNADKVCYVLQGDYVSIQHRDTFVSAEAYYASYFHELIHSTGHEKRLKRFNSLDVPRPFAGDEYRQGRTRRRAWQRLLVR